VSVPPHERHRPQEWKPTIVPQFPFCAAKLWRRSRKEICHDLQVLDQVARNAAHCSCFDDRAVGLAGASCRGCPEGERGVLRPFRRSRRVQKRSDRRGTGCSEPIRKWPDRRAVQLEEGGGATIEALARSLQVAANGLDPENDILFLILTSHGSPAGLVVKAGRLTQTLTPSNLADMLARTGVRHKVVIISACYSGVFIPRLATPDLLVITAADANHPSFGCEDKAKWTYFGNAFFNIALRQARSLKDAFVGARALVKRRELREHFEPSNPLMAGGANVQPLLIARP
jgi:hypothetical protein